MLFNIAQDITKGQVLRYLFMPQILPRIHEFYRVGFSQLAYIIALVYRGVNLLPRNHYVLQAANRNKIGVRMVLAAAASELKFSWSNIDKIIIFFSVIAGLVLLAGQFSFMLFSILINPALAATMPTTYAEFFATAHQNDIAYRMLMTVFGVPEIFGTNQGVGVGFGVQRSQYHVALHSLLQFYSIGLLVIAVIIVCYYVFAIVVETAQTGAPFGKRYNHVWTPIRLVFALGLLIPVGYGLNSAQWITLYAAKFGSDFATKGWQTFNDRMNQVFLNNAAERIGTPQTPDLTNTAAFMMVVSTCTKAYELVYPTKTISAYLVKNAAEGGAAKSLSGTSFEQARDYFKDGDILIRIGEYNPTEHSDYLGNVFPYCGDIVINTSDSKDPGSEKIQEFYYQLVSDMYSWRYQLVHYGTNFAERYLPQRGGNPTAQMPPADYKQKVSNDLVSDITTVISQAVTLQGSSSTWTDQVAKIQEYGWGGAGVWYNRIAQLNGSLVTAVNNVPEPRKWPYVMELTMREQLQQNSRIPTMFRQQMADGREVQLNSEEDKDIGRVLSTTYEYWQNQGTQQGAQSNQTAATGNFFIDVINAIFGTRGLFNMCKNADVHPLAQLSILGKGLVEASIRNLALAVGFSLGGIIPEIGQALTIASSILLSVATVTITMGFILFYVLPFMPFLYFFFAVGGWIKGLFEAMVGVPLWALAHLKIDGEGLPGDAARQGYYMIFEIFLRPILIIFGLLASIIIFSAIVKVLNEIFGLVVVNLSGHDEGFKQLCGQTIGSPSGGGGGGGGAQDAMAFFRGPIDELFFTIIYAIIVYMIGMSCFKLIDLIPNNILRFMGENVQTFNDAAEDPAQGMMRSLSVGTSVISDKVLGERGILQNATQGLRSGAQGAAEIAAPTAERATTGRTAGPV